MLRFSSVFCTRVQEEREQLKNRPLHFYPIYITLLNGAGRSRKITQKHTAPKDLIFYHWNSTVNSNWAHVTSLSDTRSRMGMWQPLPISIVCECVCFCGSKEWWNWRQKPSPDEAERQNRVSPGLDVFAGFIQFMNIFQAIEHPLHKNANFSLLTPKMIVFSELKK